MRPLFEPLTNQILWKQLISNQKPDRGIAIQRGRASEAKTTTSATTSLNIECLRTLTFREKHAELGFNEFNL
jgi:hypothetical protein